MKLTIYRACRTCGALVVIGFYDLRVMRWDPTFCDGCMNEQRRIANAFK